MGSLQFAPATGNGVAVKPGDLCQRGDTAQALLLGQKASQQPPRAFVGGCHEAVDSPVFIRHDAMRVFPARRAGARMDALPQVFRCHKSRPLLGQSERGLHIFYSHR